MYTTFNNTERGPSLTTNHQVMYLTTKGGVNEALKTVGFHLSYVVLSYIVIYIVIHDNMQYRLSRE
jgi:hypothetical protein